MFTFYSCLSNDNDNSAYASKHLLQHTFVPMVLPTGIPWVLIELPENGELTIHTLLSHLSALIESSLNSGSGMPMLLMM